MSRPDPKRIRASALAAAVAALLLLAGGSTWFIHRQHYPERFAAVVEGRLYRSGQPSPGQLAHLARRYGIRAVLSLLDPDAPQSIAERQAARELGLVWHNVPLPGDGASTPEQRQRIRDILRDPANQPLLVHCAAGSTRTGLAVGLYRIVEQGWCAEDALREMRRFGFRDKPRHQNLRDALVEESRAVGAGRAVDADAPAASPDPP